jgi:hypothetical protein
VELSFDTSDGVFLVSSADVVRVALGFLLAGTFEHELRPQHLTMFLLRDCDALILRLPLLPETIIFLIQER